jgi:hypothetical protein
MGDLKVHTRMEGARSYVRLRRRYWRSFLGMPAVFVLFGMPVFAFPHALNPVVRGILEALLICSIPRVLGGKRCHLACAHQLPFPRVCPGVRWRGGSTVAVGFYDNPTPLDDPGTADIDRVYCLDWHRFRDPEWSALDRIYRGLPGWVGYRDVPFWFGADAEDIPYLFASVEPSGLQVCGVLPASDWLEWVSRFEAAIAALPSIEVD